MRKNIASQLDIYVGKVAVYIENLSVFVPTKNGVLKEQYASDTAIILTILTP